MPTIRQARPQQRVTRPSIRVGQVWRCRNGENARIICVDREFPGYPIVMLVGLEEDPWSCTADGRVESGAVHDLDLLELHRNPETVSGWLNVYEDGETSFHTSKVGADSRACESRKACIYVSGLEEPKPYRSRRGMRKVVDTPTQSELTDIRHRTVKPLKDSVNDYKRDNRKVE